jgi:hypothetical protein
MPLGKNNSCLAVLWRGENRRIYVLLRKEAVATSTSAIGPAQQMPC